MQQSHARPVYELLAHDIKSAGVQAVFGRQLGVAIVGRGPATANARHGALFAERSGARVLLIIGATPVKRPAINALGPDGKRFDADAVLKSAGLRTFTVTHASSARATIAAALAAAEEDLAVLQLPVDVQRARPGIVEEPPARLCPRARQRPTAGALKATVGLLAASRRPVIICGLGAHEAGAREQVERIADHVGAVVAATLKAKDMFRGYAFDGGLIGSFSHAAGRRLFISTARGGVHDEDALHEAPVSGHLSGAGLNVWSVEPPALDHPLLTLDNVLATHHRAGVTTTARRQMASMGATQILALARGQRPPRLVNPEVWPVFTRRFQRLLGRPLRGPATLTHGET